MAEAIQDLSLRQQYQHLMMMYENAGKPAVDLAMEYSDVADDALYTEAVR